jgi:hypothetical protein
MKHLDDKQIEWIFVQLEKIFGDLWTHWLYFRNKELSKIVNFAYARTDYRHALMGCTRDDVIESLNACNRLKNKGRIPSPQEFRYLGFKVASPQIAKENLDKIKDILNNAKHKEKAI